MHIIVELHYQLSGQRFEIPSSLELKEQLIQKVFYQVMQRLGARTPIDITPSSTLFDIYPFSIDHQIQYPRLFLIDFQQAPIDALDTLTIDLQQLQRFADWASKQLGISAVKVNRLSLCLFKVFMKYIQQPVLAAYSFQMILGHEIGHIELRHFQPVHRSWLWQKIHIWTFGLTEKLEQLLASKHYELQADCFGIFQYVNSLEDTEQAEFEIDKMRQGLIYFLKVAQEVEQTFSFYDRAIFRLLKWANEFFNPHPSYQDRIVQAEMMAVRFKNCSRSQCLKYKKLSFLLL